MRRPRPHGGRRSRNRRSGLSPDLTGGKHKIAKTTPCKVEISLLPAPRPSPDAARHEVCLLQIYSNFKQPNPPATPRARSFARKPHPPKIKGRREDRVRAAPAVSCAMLQRNAAPEQTGFAEASGLPCAMALRLIRDRPGDPAFVTPSPPEGRVSRL